MNLSMQRAMDSRKYRYVPCQQLHTSS